MIIKKLMNSFAGMVAVFTTTITCAGCGTDYGAEPYYNPDQQRDECCEARYGFDSTAYRRCIDLFSESGTCPSDAEVNPNLEPQETIYGPPDMMCCYSLRNDEAAYQKCVDAFNETGECKIDE